MATPNEMRTERAKLIQQGRDLLERARKEGRKGLNAEEKVQYDKIMADVGTLKEEYEREEKLQELEREMKEPIREEARIGEPGRSENATEKRAEREQKAFAQFLTRGYSGLSEAEKRDLTVGTDSEGGYTMAPAQFIAKLLKKVDDMVFLRKEATVYQIAAGNKKIQLPKLAADPADSDWTTELLIGSEDNTMAMGTFDLTPNPVAKWILVSNTLLRQSALNIEDLVRDRLAYKFGITAEKAYMTGNGSGKPLGLFVASASGINTDRDLAFADDVNLDADTFKKAPYKLKAGYRQNAKWLLNRTIVEQVALFKDTTNQYIWQPGLTVGQPDTLVKYPIMESEYAPNTQTAGLYVGMLGDFKYYSILDQLELQIQRLVELKAATNQTMFIGRMEGDGKPENSEAFIRLAMAAS